MDQDSIELIQKSWRKIVGSEGMLVDHFYHALMAVRPDYQRFFPHTMLTQKRKFLEMIETIVKVLPQLNAFIPKLHVLGKQHSHLGLKANDYQIFCKVFVDSLATNSRPELTPHEKEAWIDALNIICATMLEDQG